MLLKNRITYVIAAFMVPFILSCNDQDDPKKTTDDGLPHKPGTGNVIFHLDHFVDGPEVSMNELIYVNTAGNKYSVMTLKYLISDITLHKLDGSICEIDTFFYRDIADTLTRSQAVLYVPNGNYSSISFTYGLDTEKNITAGLPNTQVLNNFEWPVPMGGGYHYMKFEGRYEKTDGTISNFNTHTGRLKTPDGEMHENFFKVALPLSAIEIKDDVWEVQIKMNLNSWYSTPHTYDLNAFGPAIMGNQEAQQILKENGYDVFSTGPISKKSNYE